MKITPEIKKLLRKRGMSLEQAGQFAEALESPPPFEFLQKFENGDPETLALVEEEAEKFGVSEEQYIGIVKAFTRHQSRRQNN